MTRKSPLLFALALALAACDGLMKSEPAPAPEQKRAPAADDEDQSAFEAHIMTGRVAVMQDQTARGLKLLGVDAPPEPDAPSDRDTYAHLYAEVERYNVLLKAACAGKVVSGADCAAPPFLPLWYAGRARPDTSPKGLKSAAEAMQDQMMVLWDPVCAKAKAKSGDPDFCAIE
jgi:hypothetical protein